jgi:hypothetical protein
MRYLGIYNFAASSFDLIKVFPAFFNQAINKGINHIAAAYFPGS